MMKFPTWSRRGLVVAEHPLAALMGRDALRRGGSFADAVVATSAMLSVVTPHLCSLGGDFFGLFCLRKKEGISLRFVPFLPKGTFEAQKTDADHGIERVGNNWCGCADIRGEGVAVPV